MQIRTLKRQNQYDVVTFIKSQYFCWPLSAFFWCKFSARYYHSYALMTPDTNASKNGLVLNVKNQANLQRICMESPEHNLGNRSSLIVEKMLNFGMDTFFILFFQNITIKLVISQINFVTSSFWYLICSGYLTRGALSF